MVMVPWCGSCLESIVAIEADTALRLEGGIWERGVSTASASWTDHLLLFPCREEKRRERGADCEAKR